MTSEKTIPKRMTEILQPLETQTWPRHLATEIIKLDNRDAMLVALNKIKPPWYGWVKYYLNDWIRKAGSLSYLKYQIEQTKLKQERKN